jgi:nucleotide-binding universal stress UspA family protein
MTTHEQLLFHPRKIMVPVDFGPSTEGAIKTAAGIAKQYGAELCLLHVVPALPALACDAYMPEERFVEELRSTADHRLRAMVKELQEQGLRAVFSIQIGNDVVGNILHTIHSQKGDLIVLSTHGMSGWRPVVFGSIAEKVMKLAECTVLLLRSTPTNCKEPLAEGRIEHMTTV